VCVCVCVCEILMFNEHIQTFDVYCTWITTQLIDKMMLIFTCQNLAIIAFHFDDPSNFHVVLKNFILIFVLIFKFNYYF
jgi:hypothetical protein